MSDYLNSIRIGINFYNTTKAHYEQVVPIRGKRASQDIRPMGRRIRTFERVVKEVRSDGDWYGYGVYGTNVVMVASTGILEFNTGGWASQTTADFIDLVGMGYANNMFRGVKRNSRVCVSTLEGEFPILGKGAFTFFGTSLKPVKPIVEHKPVINRSVMKIAMQPYQACIKYLNTMMKLSGGLISYQLRKDLGEPSLERYREHEFKFNFSMGYSVSEGRYNRMAGHIDDFILAVGAKGTEEDWIKMMCAMATTFPHESVVHDEALGQRDYIVSLSKGTIRELFARLVRKTDSTVWGSKEVVYE